MLVLHLGRWLSILFGVINLWLIYRVFLELLPDQRWLAIAAVALAAFWPTYAYMSSVMNEDTMMSVLTTLYLWMLILVIKEPAKLWPYLALGLALGVSVTVKYTTIILPLEVMVVLAVLAWRRAYGAWWWVRRTALVGICAVVASSWWFGWNFWYLNEVKKLGWLAGLLRPIFTGGPDITLSRLGYFFSGGEIGLADIPGGREAGTFSTWVQKTFQSFWGESINGLIPLSPYIFIFVGLIVGITTFGLWRLWRAEPPARKWLLLLLFHIGIFLILPLLRFNLTRRIGETAQGRHILMPSLLAVVILVIWGAAAALPPRGRPWGLALLLVGFISWTGAHVVYLYNSTPTPVPMRTIAQAAAWLSHPAGAKFGEAVELVSYELDPRPAEGSLHLNLAWRSLAYTNENYLLKIVLLDRQGQVVSHWAGFTGQGRLPTLAWDPGDSVFDRLSLPLPHVPAGDYTVQVQLSGAAGPLPVMEQGCGETAEQACSSPAAFVLTDISLPEPSTLSLPHSLTVTGPGGRTEIAFALWPAGGPTAETRPSTSDPHLPYFRYPATVTIIAEAAALKGAALDLQLVDPAGQTWPADDSTANIYTFMIGPRWPSGNYRLKMMLRQGDQVTAQATSEPLLAVENWWKRDFEVPAIASPGEANFANQLQFLGYTLPQTQVKAGQSFPLTLYWQAMPDKSPQADFVQFNHLLDSAGTLRGGYDRRPLEYYSTLLWAPGEVVTDGYTVPVAPDAPPGQYYLNVGYYLTVGESAVNLPLVVAGQMSDVTSITIGPIEVVKP
jgi:4-amino-4-deoxy-L-arabinose transferase-like glycosyltransferase